MRMRLWRRSKENNSGQQISDRDNLQEATDAEASAKLRVFEAKARGPEVQRLVVRLHEMQQVNHLGERVAQALREGYEGRKA